MTSEVVKHAVQVGAVHGDVNTYGVDSLAAATHSLPRDVTCFTGRQAEVDRLGAALMAGSETPR